MTGRTLQERAVAISKRIPLRSPAHAVSSNTEQTILRRDRDRNRNGIPCEQQWCRSRFRWGRGLKRDAGFGYGAIPVADALASNKGLTHKANRIL